MLSAVEVGNDNQIRLVDMLCKQEETDYCSIALGSPVCLFTEFGNGSQVKEPHSDHSEISTASAAQVDNGEPVELVEMSHGQEETEFVPADWNSPILLFGNFGNGLQAEEARFDHSEYATVSAAQGGNGEPVELAEGPYRQNATACFPTASTLYQHVALIDDRNIFGSPRAEGPALQYSRPPTIGLNLCRANIAPALGHHRTMTGNHMLTNSIMNTWQAGQNGSTGRSEFSQKSTHHQKVKRKTRFPQAKSKHVSLVLSWLCSCADKIFHWARNRSGSVPDTA